MYQSYVGLEIHIHLLTRTKVFCSCRSAFGDEPNTNVCPVCLGYPGALPALNGEAMRLGYVVARALECDLADECVFDRKNYFYPDLPKNYQISQFHAPLGRNGHIDLEFRKNKKRIRIRECHLEEDAGKMIHAGDQSLLDFNRAGMPLLEIVTEPDLEIGEEAEHLLSEFRRLVRYLGVCDGNMEEGSLRCDANISVNLEGQGLGTKVEIKNMNSFRFVRKALTYEIVRQTDILERGGTIIQETRLWNENRDVSESMRVKETSSDYRYFPEPDMPPFRSNDEFLREVEASLVELPRPRAQRVVAEYSITEQQAEFFCDEKETIDFFEATVKAGADAQNVASWLMGDVQKLLNRSNTSLAAGPLSPSRLSTLLDLLAQGKIHGKLAKQTLEAIFAEDKDPADIIAERGWEQINDRNELTKLISEVLHESGAAVEQIRSGDARPRGYLVGQIMKKSSGRADPKLVQTILGELLELQFVDVISFGGAISGYQRGDGIVVPGDLASVVSAVRADESLPSDIRYEELSLGEFLSEEITPGDWAKLIHAVAERLSSSGPSAMVIGHGTDTLPYTAALLHWLFAPPSVPIVLTASATPGESDEAIANLRQAVKLAIEQPPGVYVSYGGEIFPPVNLKFERVPVTGDFAAPSGASSASDRPPFRTWNAPLDPHDGGLWNNDGLTIEETAHRLEGAARQVFVAKVFPGMSSDSLIALMEAGVRFFVLELYDTGTANVRETPFSLKQALHYGQERDVAFFCTSQQEGNVDFADYVTSHELWREGAIPMGELTTESVYARLLAALLVTEGANTAAIAHQVEM